MDADDCIEVSSLKPLNDSFKVLMDELAAAMGSKAAFIAGPAGVWFLKERAGRGLGRAVFRVQRAAFRVRRSAFSVQRTANSEQRSEKRGTSA